MKILISGYHNPHFASVSEYVESAAQALGQTLSIFDNRSFLIPGGIRRMAAPLGQWDLERMNHWLIAAAQAFRPDVFLEIGGDRILPEAIRAIKAGGAKTALWITDPLQHADSNRFEYARFYDFNFCAGSEAREFLSAQGRTDARLLPFACDKDVHAPVALDASDRKKYARDVVFVGSFHPLVYPQRVRLLEAVADFDLGVWGPAGARQTLSPPLRRAIRGGAIPPGEWVKIYSAAKISLCTHYRDPQGLLPCYQVSPRVFEALACKCFLLVDRQRDVEALFEDGRHLVIFQGIPDLREKIRYYLEHPEERLRIAEAGHAEVLGKHTYVHRLRELFAIVGS